MYLINKAAWNFNVLKCQKSSTVNEWTIDKKLNDKTGGANNSDHDCT